MKKIVIVAGEASGDLHGSRLVKELKNQNPEIMVLGLGGKLMQEAGVELYADIVNLAVVGFMEVLRNFKKIRQIFNLLLKKIDSLKPDLVILIDYPGFNLRLARELKKRKIPVIYYISPQIWAWGKSRIKLIKEVVDKMIVFFKFEETLYRKENIEVEFVGHPLLDTVRPQLSEEEALKKFSLDKNKFKIGLLPGSRKSEIKKILPIMLKTAHLLYEKEKHLQFIILKAQSLPERLYKKILAGYNLPLQVIEDPAYEGRNVCDLLLTASGTATLESTILEKPMIIVYKITFLSWLLIKNLIFISCIGMVNVVAGRQIVPEFLQYNARPQRIAETALKMLGDDAKRKEIKEGLIEVKNRLGSPGASSRAAGIILNFLKNH